MSESKPLDVLGHTIPTYLLVTASAWLSRILTTSLSIVSIRILLDTLGVDQYAAYVVLIGVASWFMLADLGTGQSLQNYISESRANNKDYSQDIICGAVLVLVLALIAVATIVVLGEMSATLLLSQFESLTNQQKHDSFLTIAILTALTAMGGLIYRIWYAEHKGYLANIYPAVAALIGLCGLYLISISELENKLILCLVAANVPTALLPLISLTARLTRKRSVIEGDVLGTINKLLKRGVRFWLFNIAAFAVFQTDYILLSQFVPPEQIVIYSIGAKIFSIMAFMTSAVLQAFWPVCAEAVVKGDWRRINGFLRWYIMLSILSVVVFTGAILLVRNEITSLLSPSDSVLLPSSFIILLGVLYIIRVWTDVFAVILQSMNDLKVLLIWALIQAAIGIGLQFILVPIYGIYGTVISLCFSWILTVSWILPRRVLRHRNAAIVE